MIKERVPRRPYIAVGRSVSEGARATRWLAGALLGLVVALGCPAAHASDKAAAEALFRQGKSLMDAGRIEEACAKLAASVAAEMAVGSLLNLALCHEKLGKTASAWAEYQQAAEMARQLGDRRREKGAADRAQKLEPKISRLVVQIAEATPGLVIARNGALLAEGSWNSPLPVDPGEQEILASAPGHESWAGSVTVLPDGDTQTLLVPALAPSADATAPPAPDEGPALLTIGGGVLVGVGLAGIVVSAVLGGIAADDVAEAEDTPALCPERVCTAAGRAQIDQARAYADGATAAFVIGGATLVAGIVMLVWPDDPAESSGDETTVSRPTVVPMVGRTGGGLAVVSRF